MTLAERLRHALLRWSRLWLAAVLALPLTLSSALGFVWLYERGWLLWFALATAGFYAVLRLGLAVTRWHSTRRSDPQIRDIGGPEADPDWSGTERAAFERAQDRINARLVVPLPWDALPAEALAVVEAIANDLSNGQRSALDFSVPEALMLIDRVALRYRAFLLHHVPYSDRLSVRAMHWVWRKQDSAQAAWDTGFLAWRGVRLLMNPAAGLLREAERLLATGLQSRLTDHFRRDTQVILLEEAAQAAIDLYSGRLKFTEGELTALAARRDQAEAVPAEAALRVVVVGQIGSGKTALVQALLGDAVGAAAPSTPRRAAYDLRIGGQPCRLIDTPGLDGGKVARALVDDLLRADLVLWLHRATRPGRAPDTALAAAFAERLTAQAGRLQPPVLHLASGAATLPGPARDAAMAAIGEVMGAPPAVPVEPPASVAAILAAFPDARRAQRARLRAEAGQNPTLATNAARAGRGLRAVARQMGGWFRR